jgi:hypothetical protein
MQNETNINKLLQKLPKNTVAVYSWLKDNSVSKSLAEYYRKSGWLDSFGVGAFIRRGDKVNEFGALFTLQNHLKLPVHIGGLSALNLHGLSHYLREGAITQIFNEYKSSIPSWFRKSEFFEVKIYNTNFLPADKYSVMKLDVGLYQLKIASPERAILEVLYLCPDEFDLTEAFHLVENLVSLRPKIMQELLENCNSIKVKRLACFMFEKAGHEWFKRLDLSKINLGSGNRKIVKHGAYNSKYKIIIPKDLKDGNNATV